MLVLVMAGCSQQTKDKGIKQIIATTAKKEIAFAGVNYSVAGGVVTLSGNCATEKERSKIESTVKQTAGVKEVINLITISPVTLTGEHLLKQAVDSVLMKYPTVNAVVEDSIIYLQGQVKDKDAEKIMTGLQGLGAKGVTNQLMTANR
ncbi:MAG TPA: BON domain-containing protein [Flavisolibacter sp.]